MSLITRCPACQTSFKVVPDQLRISQGWVRCGQCQEIFDGNAQLLQLPTPQPDDPTFNASEALPEQSVDIELTGSNFAQSADQAVSAPLAPTAARVDDSMGAGAARGSEAFSRALIEPIFEAAPAAPAGDPPVAALTEPIENLDANAPADVPSISFLRPMPQHSVWRRPLVRAVLGFGLFLLAVALLLQVVFRERDLIATQWPETKPYLQQACVYVECKVLPLKQIEAMVMESSSLSALGGDGYRLDFVIRNVSTLDLAVPALELTLTDSQDLPVIRRVLLPVELGASFNELSAGKEWPGSIAISVRALGTGQRVAGYRVATLYP